MSALLLWITSKNNGDFYFLNFFYSFKTENKLTSHEKVSKSKDSCEIVMQTEKNNVTVDKKRILKKFAKDKNYQEVNWVKRDNCHYTGKYRGAVHNVFNLKFNLAKFLWFFIMVQILIIILSLKK